MKDGEGRKGKSLRGLKHDARKGAEMGRMWYFYHVVGTEPLS
jgi:hypothetical protein